MRNIRNPYTKKDGEWIPWHEYGALLKDGEWV